jgi:hypothetical protein
MTPTQLFLLRYCHVYGMVYSETHSATIKELVQLGYVTVVNGVCLLTNKAKKYL